MDDPDFKLLLAILLVLIAAGAGWYFRDELLPKQDEPAVTLSEETSAAATAEGVPKYPVAPYASPKGGPVELIPLPPLDDSDGYFLLALVDVFGAAIEPLLLKDAIIDRFVATVDIGRLIRHLGMSGKPSLPSRIGKRIGANPR